MIECGVAIIILGTAVVSTAQLTIAVTAQQRWGLQQQIARQEAANLMERIFAIPDQQFAAETVEGLALSEAARRLSDVRHTVTIEPVEGAAAARRIQVEIHWTGAAGQPSRPVRLVAWRYLAEVQP